MRSDAQAVQWCHYPHLYPYPSTGGEGRATGKHDGRAAAAQVQQCEARDAPRANAGVDPPKHEA
jgi:hypothetical protein